MNVPTNSVLLTTLFLLAGCTHGQTDRRSQNDHREGVVYTGSRIPQPRNRVTAAPLSANTPAESVARDPDSLVPTEPVVGATDNSGGHGDTGPTPQGH